MHSTQKGMILVTVLVFISLISLLVWMDLEVGDLQMRMSHNQHRRQQAMQVAYLVLRRAHVQLGGSVLPSCVLPDIAPSELANYSYHWWQSGKLCQGAFLSWQYQYFFSALPESGSEYWRITVRVSRSNEHLAIALVQKVCVRGKPL